MKRIAPALILATTLAATSAARTAAAEEGAVEPSLRIMTLNMVHGWKRPFPPQFRARAVGRSLDAIANVVRREHPDVVGFQEIDDESRWSGGVDELGRIQEKSGLPYAFFGAHRVMAGPMHDRHGTALLSRLPLERAASSAFRTSFLDDKGYVVATARVGALEGVDVEIASVHLDPFLEGTRRAQIAMMSKRLAARTEGKPLIIMGDMNAAWRDGRGAVARLAETFGLHAYFGENAENTYSARQPWRRIDWILVSRELEFVSYRTLPDVLSDHRAVVADVGFVGARRAKVMP
jgi:endonuclease/exonuclease/phosphatase family metal-dependent hydrolase